MNTHRKLFEFSKAGRERGKTIEYLQNLSVLIYPYLEAMLTSFSNIAETVFTFTLSFPMPQDKYLADTHINRRTGYKKIKVWPKKCIILCFLDELEIKKRSWIN